MTEGIDNKQKDRDILAGYIIKIHKNQIPMDPGWREQNEFRLSNFAYALADFIINGRNPVRSEGLQLLNPLPTPPAGKSKDYNDGFNECKHLITTKMSSLIYDLLKNN